MKKFSLCIFVAALIIFLLRPNGFAGLLSYGSGDNQIYLYQQLQQANFFMYKDWLSADIVTEPIGATFMSFTLSDTEYNYTLEPSFLFEFDYKPDVNINLLMSAHSSDTFSIYSNEDAKFEVKYVDPFLEQSAGYPKLILHLNGVFHSTNTLVYDSVSDTYQIYIKTLNLSKGEYKYQYITTNDEYMPLLGEYFICGNWNITSLPYGFERISPLDYSKELPSLARFKWNVFSDEGDLFYEFYIGQDSSKDSLEKYSSFLSADAQKEYTVSGLDSVKQYYWYMKIKNKHGAFIETDLFTFYTGGNVEKFYNAPNPFNPARGQETQFVFNMPEDGTVKLSIYSEYGDKVYEMESFIRGGGGDSKSIFYNGKDNSGRALYNGSYIAVLTKKCAGQTKTERCRILIIK